MEKELKVALLGSGVMGEAFIAGLLRNEMVSAHQILASDPLQARRDTLKAEYGIETFESNNEAAKQADVIIIATKPQFVEKVLSDMKGTLRENDLVISIVAGITLETLAEGLQHPCIVRVMPNTPAQIGEGISVWTTSPDVSETQMDTARQILSSLGPEVYLADEHYLDMATALSGTGPAYIFMFMEAMIDAGVHLGFPRYIAEQLVTQTVRGSVDYYSMKKDHPASLRNEVTSPGGTSAAAIYYLEKAGFRTAISRAVWAAYERSQELGKGKKSSMPKANNH